MHGGLRYLEMFDFGLVKEALEERGLLLTRIAPHLVRPVAFLYPLHHTWERPYVGAGLVLYDGMAMAGKYEMGVPKHKHVFRRQLARMAPDLRTEDLTGAIRYFDCQVDDARLVMNIARTAAAYGAHVASRTKVIGFLREGDRVVGARLMDLENDREIEVRAKVVVNAGGVWTNEIQEMLGGRGALDVEASKGVHLVVPRDRIRSECGFITKTEKSVLFVIPWGHHWIIGTTDTPWDLDLAHPAASRADIDYVLGHVNKLLRTPLDHTDVEGVYAGLRPLLQGRHRAHLEDLARAHRRDADARAGDDRRRQADHLPRDGPGRRRRRGEVARRRTRREHHRPGAAARGQRLRGAHQPAGRDRPVQRARHRAHRPPARPVRRAGRRGARADRRVGPSSPSRCRVPTDYLLAEVVYAVTHEGARHLDDVLARRTRISIETFDRGTSSARIAAELMAAELGWDDARLEDEVDHYLRRVEAERQSQEMPTDQEADEARVSAPEGPWAV